MSNSNETEVVLEALELVDLGDAVEETKQANPWVIYVDNMSQFGYV